MKILKKKAQDLTVGESLKISGVILVLSTVVTIIPFAICWVYSKIKKMLKKSKENKD